MNRRSEKTDGFCRFYVQLGLVEARREEQAPTLPQEETVGEAVSESFWKRVFVTLGLIVPIGENERE